MRMFWWQVNHYYCMHFFRWFSDAGGLAAYFKAYPTVKFINKTITPIRPSSSSATPTIEPPIKQIINTQVIGIVIFFKPIHRFRSVAFVQFYNFAFLIFAFCHHTHIDKNPAPGICLPIIIKFCQNNLVPYNYTIYPNYIGHFSQIEAEEDLEPYEAIVDVQCYELASLFLCTLFVPKCGSAGYASQKYHRSQIRPFCDDLNEIYPIFILFTV